MQLLTLLPNSSSMNSLYNLLLRQSSSLHSDLTRLETSFLSSQSIPQPSSLSSFQSSLSAFSRTIEDYHSLAKRELNQIKQSKALIRVEKFRDEEINLNKGLEELKSGRVLEKVKREPPTISYGNGNGNSSTSSAYSASRSPTANTAAESPFANIHARTNSSNPYANSSNSDPLSAYKMNDSAAAMFGGGSSGREGMALREHSFIQNTEAQLDNFIAQGREVWGSLSEQRDILKGTQRRLLDAANTMGLSRDVIVSLRFGRTRWTRKVEAEAHPKVPRW